MAYGVNNAKQTTKTQTRPYLYSLGKKYGMKESDVDKIIGWDNDTKQVSLGGKSIGTPDALVNGVSYWNDTKVLDDAFTDYINRTGITRSKETAVNQENEGLFAKYIKEYEDLKSTNPFETDTAKAILAKYDLAGLQGRDNEVASGGASNGGNIDSFAAANAMRQQAALVNQGQQVVLDAHQQKLDHARALLSDMGVNIDRVFNESETEKNNQVSRDVATSEVTGEVPASMMYQTPLYNQFFNPDGTLKNPDIDYKAEIEKAESVGNTELAKVLRAARGVKIFSDYGKYGQYADGDYTVPGTKITEPARQFNEKIAQADRALGAEHKNALDQIAAKGKYTATNDMTLAQATSALKGGELNDKVLAVYNANHGTSYTLDNPPPIYKPAVVKPEDKQPAWPDGGDPNAGTKPAPDASLWSQSPGGDQSPGWKQPPVSNDGVTLTTSQITAWANRLNKDISGKYPGVTAVESNGSGNYTVNPTAAEYTAMRVLESDELTDAQKQYLLFDVFGVSPKTIENMMKDPHYN